MRGNREFARFVMDHEQEGDRLDLDELILVWALTEQRELDRHAAARHLQLRPEDAAMRLRQLRERGLAVPRGRGPGSRYRLPADVSDRLRGPEWTNLEYELDAEALRLRVITVLRERGRLTNAEVRAMSGLERVAAFRLMDSLRAEGLAEPRGRGRGAHWVRGPADA